MSARTAAPKGARTAAHRAERGGWSMDDDVGLMVEETT
jgi:hypothetical protein